MLTVELANTDQVEIHFDEHGLSDLLVVLEHLAHSPGQDHVHLMTPSWGGDALTEEAQSDETRLINMLTIYRWPT